MGTVLIHSSTCPRITVIKEKKLETELPLKILPLATNNYAESTQTCDTSVNLPYDALEMKSF